MRKALIAFLSSIAILVGLLTVTTGAANASYGGDCNFASVCLYQWIDYGSPTGNRWQSSISNIYNHAGHCLNISPATYTNGDPVADNAGSSAIIGDAAWNGHDVQFFNWVNCNASGGYTSYGAYAGAVHQQTNLNAEHWVGANTGIPLYHTVTSILVTP